MAADITQNNSSEERIFMSRPGFTTCTRWARQLKSMGFANGYASEETELGYALHGSKMVWVIVERPENKRF